MRRFLTAAAIVGLALFVPAGQAFAHAQLESSNPSNGEALDESPTELVFDFNESVSLEFGAVSLTNEAGDTIELDAPTLRSADVVVVALPPLSEGQYVAGYQVVSADGHPVSGNIVFRVGAGTVDTSASGESSSSRTVDTVYGAVRFVAYPPLVLAAGIPLCSLVLWPQLRRRARRAWLWAAGVLAVATAAQFMIAVPYLSGGGWSDAVSPQQWWTMAGTTTGMWLIARFTASVVLLVSLKASRRSAQLPHLIGWATAAVLVASFVGEGHSATGGWFSIDAAATFLHITAMSVWLTGLVVIAWGVRHDDHDLLLASLRRWTPTATTAVALLAATGVVQALAVRPDGGSFSTRYLVVLLAKVAMVAVMIAFGDAGRRALRRRGATAAWPTSLRTTVAIELVIAIIVLGATTVLSQTEPGAAAATGTSTEVAQQHPQRLVIALGDRTMTVDVDDMVVGRRSMDVTVDDTSRPFADPVTLQARLTMPEKGLGPIPILFETVGPRQWTTDQLEIPDAGTWQLELFVIDPQSKARFSTTIDFHLEGQHHDS